MRERLNVRRIISEASLKVKFQKIVSHHNEFPKSVEAFIIGIDPDDGSVISPLDLIQAAESEDEHSIEELNRLMVQVVIEAFSKLLEEAEGMLLHVNIHESLVGQPEKTLQWILEKLSVYEISPSTLVFDIADYKGLSVMEVRAFIDASRDAGFYISLDDIGKSYFNLDRIMVYNPDMIKINQQYLDRLDLNGYRNRLKEQTSYVAHEMGIIVVFTGIETEEQLGQAFEFGCQYFQGYLIEKPCIVTEETISTYIENMGMPEKFRPTVIAPKLEETRATMNKMVVVLNRFREESRRFLETEVDSAFEELFRFYPYVQNAWIVGMDGKQVTNGKINNEGFRQKNGYIFKIYDKGHDFSQEQFYQILTSGTLDVWITKPYTSLLNNKLCLSTASIIEAGSGTQYILCLEVNYTQFNNSYQIT